MPCGKPHYDGIYHVQVLWGTLKHSKTNFLKPNQSSWVLHLSVDAQNGGTGHPLEEMQPRRWLRVSGENFLAAFVTAPWSCDLVTRSSWPIKVMYQLVPSPAWKIKRIFTGTHLIPVDIREDSLEISVQCRCVSKDNFPSPADKWGHLLCDSISFFSRKKTLY